MSCSYLAAFYRWCRTTQRTTGFTPRSVMAQYYDDRHGLRPLAPRDRPVEFHFKVSGAMDTIDLVYGRSMTGRSFDEPCRLRNSQWVAFCARPRGRRSHSSPSSGPPRQGATCIANPTVSPQELCCRRPACQLPGDICRRDACTTSIDSEMSETLRTAKSIALTFKFPRVNV